MAMKMIPGMSSTTAGARTAPLQPAKSARRHMLATRRRIRGFTLVEIMITIVTVAIVAAVALPNYLDYVTRTKIAEATSGLNDMRVRLAQYFADTRGYPTACIAAATNPAPVGKVYLPAGIKYFTFSCALTATSFTVTATGDASRGMAGFAYTIDQTSNRKTTSLPSGWSGAGASSSCWVTRKSGDC
jgi:type IV pilus assembly protein PilE